VGQVRQRPDTGRLTAELAELLAEAQAKRLLAVRQPARAVTGAGSGSEGNLAKLLRRARSAGG
jgi:hypothetical protein